MKPTKRCPANSPRIRVLREKHDTPESVERRLRLAGGMNRFGEPMYRAVWGWNRLAWMGGKFVEKDENTGCIVREVVQLRLEPKYPKVNRWHIEKWLAPEMYGSPRAWYAQTIERADGQSIPALGPYPVRGEYEHVFTLEAADGGFLQLTSRVAEGFARALEYSRRFPASQRMAALHARETKADRDYENWAYDILDDGVGAFGERPFVTVA